MIQYLFKSRYRFALLGLLVALTSLWYFWFKTDQIISSSLVLYSSGIVILNAALAFFSYDRHDFVTRSLIVFSYLVIGLAAYTIYSLTKGIR